MPNFCYIPALVWRSLSWHLFYQINPPEQSSFYSISVPQVSRGNSWKSFKTPRTSLIKEPSEKYALPLVDAGWVGLVGCPRGVAIRIMSPDEQVNGRGWRFWISSLVHLWKKPIDKLQAFLSSFLSFFLPFFIFFSLSLFCSLVLLLMLSIKSICQQKTVKNRA